jgi:LPS export ABC transporter protein LptC
MTRRAVWLVVVLVLVGLFAWLAPRHAVEGRIGASADTSQDEPGYVAIDAELIETGEDGEPIYRLNASRIEQARAGARIQLTEPRLAYQASAESSWRLQAAHGELAPELQQVEFGGAVEATGNQSGAAPIVIRTEQLSIDMQQQRADSLAGVIIDWGRVRLTAHGFHINLRDGSLKLDSQGHGETLY